jgi:hypothetical protein
MPRSRISQPPSDWSPAGQKLEEVLMAQGRQTDWLAERLRISRNYLYRMRLNPTNPMYRMPQPGLWAKCERILGLPTGTIKREDRSRPDPTVVEARLKIRRQAADDRHRDERAERFAERLKQIATPA